MPAAAATASVACIIACIIACRPASLIQGCQPINRSAASCVLCLIFFFFYSFVSSPLLRHCIPTHDFHFCTGGWEAQVPSGIIFSCDPSLPACSSDRDSQAAATSARVLLPIYIRRRDRMNISAMKETIKLRMPRFHMKGRRERKIEAVTKAS